MGEQLWYTWSDSGFGANTAGFQVRAASRGFIDARGFMDPESKRFQTLKKYLNYPDTSIPPDVIPEQAPRSLLFIQTGQERILVNRVYTGKDGIGRPGAFFSHLLTDLPPVSSLCPDKQLPFSAREAIELWGSAFWKHSEQSINPKQRELLQVSNEELAMGPLSARHMAEVTEPLSYVIQAFLTLSTLGEGKRLYIAAPPDTVATLIWGLTHVLPRTLQIMRSLTFSTYERDLEEKILFMYGKQTAEKTLPIIIGTCWLSSSAQDLPSIYYQEQNPHGFALNCYLPDRKTPLIPDPLVSKFAQFAIRCFASENMQNLKALLDEAEKRNVTDIPSFLALHASFQENIPKEDITHLLRDFYTKCKMLLDKAVSAIKEGKILPEDEFRLWKSIQSEIDTLKRENVRNSIIHLLTQEPSWWQEQGKNFIVQLQDLVNSYPDNELKMLRVWAFNSRKGQNLATLTASADQITDTLRTTQKILATALLPLMTDFAGQIVEAIWSNDDQLTSFWSHILAASVPARTRLKADVWASLLQKLSHSPMPYSPVYHRWWTQSGKTSIQEMSTLAHTQPSSDLGQAYFSFIDQAAQELLGSIRSGEMAPMSFWQEVLSTTAPYTSKADVWLNLLLNLCQAMDSPTYQQWWQAQGKEVANSLRQSAERDPHGEIAQKLTIYADNVANVLYARMIDKTSKTPLDGYIQLLTTIITTVRSPGHNEVWPNLLHQLSTTMHEPTAKAYSWELRSSLLKTWANIPILEKNQYIRRDWLTVRWDELYKLLSLQLPDNWYRTGITEALRTTSDFSQINEISVVKDHPHLFEEVLELLLKAPTAQQITLSFFALLAQHHYSRIFPLLDRLFAACQYQKEVTEKLLASLPLSSSKERANLLENHCKVLLSEHELPPTLLNFLRQYLKDFDPEYLDSSPTQELLWQLSARKERPDLELPPDLQKLCEGWYWIAEFIIAANVEDKEDWLDNLIYGAAMISQLTSDVRSKLAAKLLPHLVEFTSTEIDLGRVIDHLNGVLIEPDQRDISRKFLLLEQMAKKAGGKYGQERPPVRIALYIKVVLGECRFLPPAEEASFVDRCLGTLLKQIDTQTRETFTTDLMRWWPKQIVAGWRAYLSRSSLATSTKRLNDFRSALQNREMFAIVQAYDPSLKDYLHQREYDVLELARKFVAAYQADDDESLVNVYDVITQSPYHEQLGYTKAQKERIKQAQNHLSAASQQTTLMAVQNMPTQIFARPSPIPSQEVLASQEHFIARVKGQIITLEWFKQVLQLKGPYTEFRISDLLERIQKLEQTDPTDRTAKKELILRKSQLHESKKLSGHSERLPEAALDNLVNDVLIREAIDQLTSQDPTSKEWLDVEAKLPTILETMKIHQGDKYPPLLSKDHSVIENILNILRIFHRYERFTLYLYWNRSIPLSDWLKKQRKREEANISINYVLAGIKAPGVVRQIVNKVKG